MSNQVSNPLQVVSLPQFCADQGFVELVPEVRSNTNGYPYITLINQQNVATNIYFSKKEAQNVHQGQLLTSNYLKELRVVESKNAAGEIRYKLTSGNSSRVSISSLFADAKVNQTQPTPVDVDDVDDMPF